MLFPERGESMEKRVILFPTFSNYEEGSEAKQLDFEEIGNKVVDFRLAEKERRLDDLEDQAYDWFLRELKEEDHMKFVLNDLSAFFAKYGVHYSIFHKKGYTTFLRMYWPEENAVAHIEIDNYERISRNSPGLTDYLVKNGVYSFLEDTDPKLCYELFRAKSRKTN